MNIVDANTFEIKSILKGHTESVKTITCLKTNTSIIASGARDGSILIYDLRYNKKSSDESYHSINTIINSHHNAGVATPTPKSRLNNNNSNVSPVSSILFQNENLIISAGATDNLIKVWDLRKTYSNRITNPQPLLSFKNEITTKGYSNLIISKSRLFANCMNNTIYDFDLISYKCDSQSGFNLHKNSSNFVKSCSSIDDNFILTGSSDSNAYIYPINYKNCVSVLKLDGAHQNEVTCVAWSPHDINQLITCSDDNSVRVWNVKNDLNSIEKQENLFKTTEIEENNKIVFNSDDNIKLFNQKFYFNQQLASTSVYNDIIFTNFQTKYEMNERRSYFKGIQESFKTEKTNHVLSPTSNLPSNLKNISKEKQASICVTPKQVSLVQTRIDRFRSNENTPINQQKQQQLSSSTTKKRPLDKIFNEMLNLNTPQQQIDDLLSTATPQPSSKRRLVLDSTTNNQLKSQSMNSKSLTILDYFSAKSAKK